MRILLVDSDADLSDMVAYTLKRHGHQVVQASDGESALQLWRKENPDMILLDVRLPRMTGWELCSYIRGHSRIPMIVLTSAAEEDDIVRGLDLGADDYIVKPVRPRELIARLRAVRRRTDSTGDSGEMTELAAGRLRLNPRDRSVELGSRSLRLTRLEFRVLYELVRHEGQVVSYEALTERAWGYAGVSDSSMLKSHIRHLREKLEVYPSNPSIIVTVPGAGYSFRAIETEHIDEQTEVETVQLIAIEQVA